MHNMHIVIVSAKNGKDACEDALSYIRDWGDENNWRSAVCAIPKDRKKKIYINKETSRYCGVIDSLKELNEICSNVVHELYPDEQNILNLMKNPKNITPGDWYAIKEYANTMQRKILYKDKGFDPFEDEYFSGCYDEFGVTNTISSYDEIKNLWAVVIDIHS